MNWRYIDCTVQGMHFDQIYQRTEWLKGPEVATKGKCMGGDVRVA